MKRLSLLFLIFILFFHFYEGRHYFCYSQQLQKENDEAAREESDAESPLRASVNSLSHSEEEYLKYEGPNIAQAPNIFGASIRMITVLLVLLALFFSVIFFLKKFQQRRSIQEKGPISVLCRLPVGSKESILIVDVMGEILALGVTSAQISLLFREGVSAESPLRASVNSQAGLSPQITIASHAREGVSQASHAVEDADKLTTFQNYLKSDLSAVSMGQAGRENIKVASELRSNELRSTVLESLRALREKLRKV